MSLTTETAVSDVISSFRSGPESSRIRVADQLHRSPRGAPEEPLPALLAKTDVTKGRQDAKICEAGHNFQKGGGAKIGPDLWDVVGRRIASVATFAYSDALKGVNGDWSYEILNKWFTDPNAR